MTQGRLMLALEEVLTMHVETVPGAAVLWDADCLDLVNNSDESNVAAAAAMSSQVNMLRPALVVRVAQPCCVDR